MAKLFVLAVVSVGSLLVLGMFGIQTGVSDVDLWVNSVLSIL